jgi:type 1 glutamine amidotransferase
MARIVKRIVLVLLGLFLLLAALVVWAMGPGNFGRMALGIGTHYETDPPKLPALNQPAILIFSKTNGFREDASIKAANAALEKMVKDKGWSSYTTENAAVFNAAQLAKFKAVVWNSVSGDVLTADQRAAFKAWLEQGGGFVGLHGSGGDPSYKWDWYVNDLIGAQFIGHTLSPQFQQGRLVIEDSNHPATKGLGSEWTRTEEWYSFNKSPRTKGYHILVTLDESSYSPHEKIPLFVDKDLHMGKDHPMVWTHCVGNGRAFYSALGHQADSYAEPKHLELIAGAISWAAGLEEPGCVVGKEVAAKSN